MIFTHICVLKLNGWPETFDERLEVLLKSVNRITVVRPLPEEESELVNQLDNVSAYNLYPKRGSFVHPSILKPVVFALHVFQAVFIVSVIMLFSEDKPEVVHALDYVLGGFAGAIVSELFSIPLVVSIRGLKETQYHNIKKREQTSRAKLEYRILTLLSGWVIHSSDHIITKSKYQVDFIQEHFHINVGFTTIPTGVNFTKFDPEAVSDQDVLQKIADDVDRSIPTNTTNILYLSKLIPRKGPDKIIQLVHRIDEELPDDIVFFLIGEPREATFEAKLRESQENIRDRIIIFPNHVSFDRAPALIASSDAVILYSEPNYEGVPRILQEACAMQTPIIAADVSGISEAFRGLPGCYLLDRDDPDELCEVLKTIATDPPTMDRDVFREKFDIYHNYGQYAEVYESLT